ncbi:hypothetical protein [Photobacterium sp. Hal280]|uniref:hypothetical protein n=1 Tax=Photobacterium sp. Hal280 TaxID=3035163 RepID=UPI00301D75D4
MKKAALIALAAFHRKLAGILTDDVSFITLCLFTEQKCPTVLRDGKRGILPERYPLQCSLLTKISPDTERKLTSTLMTAISAGLDTVLAASSDFFVKIPTLSRSCSLIAIFSCFITIILLFLKK